MGVNSLPKTVIWQRNGCYLNPGPSAPESNTLTTRLPSNPVRHSYIVIQHKCSNHSMPWELLVIWDNRQEKKYDLLVYVTHTHTHTFNGPFSRSTQVSRYQKGKTNLDFTKARDSEWQWHQLGHMQVCTSLQTITTPAPHHCSVCTKTVLNNCSIFTWITEWWDAGVVVCLEQGADLHLARLMPLPLTVSCFSKIQIGSTFLVSAHLGSPGKRAVKRMCVCVCVYSLESVG